MKYENDSWVTIMPLPDYVEASHSTWTVSEEFILIECFLADQLHTSIGLINLTTREFTQLNDVICENGYGPSFTIYNKSSVWYVCRHYKDISVMQYDYTTNLQMHITTYGPVFAPVSKVSGLCPFGNKFLVWVLVPISAILQTFMSLAQKFILYRTACLYLTLFTTIGLK